MGNRNDNARRSTDDIVEPDQHDGSTDNRTPSEDDRVNGDIPTGRPHQPIPEESQFMPDTGDRPLSPSGRSEEDIMDEARDGFMDRYPPKGQTS